MTGLLLLALGGPGALLAAVWLVRLCRQSAAAHRALLAREREQLAVDVEFAIIAALAEAS